MENLKELYQQVKDEEGFFDPQTFLNKVSDHYSIEIKELRELLWDESDFQQYLLVDKDSFRKIRDNMIIGIFSRGEINFQKKKIELLKDFIDSEHIHVFKNKSENIGEVLEKYKYYRIYVVDDSEYILEGFKKADKDIFTILVSKEPLIANEFVDAKITNAKDLINSRLIDFAA